MGCGEFRPGCERHGINLLVFLIFVVSLLMGGVQELQRETNRRARLNPNPAHCEPWPDCAATETSHCIPWPECRCDQHCDPWPACAETENHTDLCTPYPYCSCPALAALLPEPTTCVCPEGVEAITGEGIPTAQAETTPTPAPIHTTQTETTPPPTTTTPPPIATLNSSNATAANTTNTANETAVVASKRKTMDPAEAAALAASVSTAVGVVIAGVVAASATGVIPPSPGAMAIIGQVQVLSQIGKVGGGGGALGAFSESFGWANGDLPFSLFAAGNELATEDGNEVDTNTTGVRRWMETAPRSFRRVAKKARPPPGETSVAVEDPDCDNATLTDKERSHCLECGLMDGIPLLDKLVLVFASMICVFCVRAVLQLIVTKGMKKEPFDALMFPNWEGPLLLSHWFGMCDSLTNTLGRPCTFWVILSCAIILFGPIFFLLFSVWSIARHIRNGAMQYEEQENVTWKETRENLKEAHGIKAKLSVLQAYYHAKRNKGEWVEETKESKFWSFLVKDFSKTAWKYCVWLLVRKLLFAAAMGLTLGALNAGCVVILHIFDVSIIFFMNPFSDNAFNTLECFGAVNNLLSLILVSMPTLYGEMPQALGDFIVICVSLMATVMAAAMAVFSPIFAVVGVVAGFCMGLMPGGLPDSGAVPGSNALFASGASIRDSMQGIIEDSLDQLAEGVGEDDVDMGDAAWVGAGAAAVGGAAYYANKRAKALEDGLEISDTPANVTLKLGLDFSAAGKEDSKEREVFTNQLTQDLADASCLPPSRFDIKKMSAGSIVVNIDILPDPTGKGLTLDPVFVAEYLVEQAADPESFLRNGSITYHTESICDNTKPLKATVLDEEEFFADVKTRLGKRSLDASILGSVSCAGNLDEKPPTRALPSLPTERLFAASPRPDEEEKNTSKLSRRDEWAVSYARRHRLLEFVSQWALHAYGKRSRMENRASALALRKTLARCFSSWYSGAHSRRMNDLIDTGNVLNRQFDKHRCRRLLAATVQGWAEYILGYSFKARQIKSNTLHFRKVMAFQKSALACRSATLMKDTLTKWLLETKRFGNNDSMSWTADMYMPSTCDDKYFSSPPDHIYISSPADMHNMSRLPSAQMSNSFSQRSTSGIQNDDFVVQIFDKGYASGHRDSHYEILQRYYEAHGTSSAPHPATHPTHQQYFDSSDHRSNGNGHLDPIDNRLGPTISYLPAVHRPMNSYSNTIISPEMLAAAGLRELYSGSNKGGPRSLNEGYSARGSFRNLDGDDSQCPTHNKAESDELQAGSGSSTTTAITGADDKEGGAALSPSHSWQTNGLVSDLIEAALVGPQFLEQKLLFLSQSQSSLGDLADRLEHSAECYTLSPSVRAVNTEDTGDKTGGWGVVGCDVHAGSQFV